MTRISQSKASLTVPRDVLDALDAIHSPIMISHIVPDADALGSMLSLARARMDDTCRPRVSLPADSLSRKLAFMSEWASVPVATEQDFDRADGFVVLDTAKRSRCNVGPELKKKDWSAGRPVINIDHHGTNTRFGSVNWVMDGVSSTSEMVYYLLCQGNIGIDDIVASLLYGGIQTDTIGFSLASTGASALHAAAELVARGARVAELGERLCRSQRKSEFDLLRVIYANTKLLDGGVAYSSAGYEEIHGTGCRAADIDDQVSIPRSLHGVRLAMLFTEGKRGKTRINFRGSGRVTVVELAAEFNGGGHAQAAGAVLNCGLTEAIDRIVPRAIEHLKKFPPA